MSRSESPDGTAADLHRAVDSLSSAGEWSELARRFEEAGIERTLGDMALAYSYGETLYHAGRMDDLSDFAARFEEAAARRADGRGVLRALNLGAIAAFELGRIDEARTRSERQVALADSEGDPDMLARATQNLAAIAGLEGRIGEAIASFELAHSAYVKLGQIRGMAQVRHNLGNCFRDVGRYDDADDAYREAEHGFRRVGYPRGVAMATIGRAEVALLSGDGSLGFSLADRAVSVARDCGDSSQEADALRVRARARLVRHGQGNRPKAVRDLSSALRLARRTGNLLHQAEIERDAARLRIETGRPDRARGSLRRALARFEKLGAVAEARKVREQLESLG